MQIRTHGKVEALKILLAYLEPDTPSVDSSLLRGELYDLLTGLELPDEVLAQLEEVG